ncbi:MAG: pyruvate kinase [Candidatus Helarchaeota archaeon]
MNINMRKTKIIATIGPASSSPNILRNLVKNVDVVRLNFSYGDHKTHKETIRNIRAIAEELNLNTAILQDIQGPKIRINKILNGEIELNYNDTIKIVPNMEILNPDEISITYDSLYKDVKTGDKILISDGFIELEVLKIENKTIYTKVIQGGILKEKKGLNVPTKLNIPTISEKDYEDIIFGLQHEVDYIAISFVRSPNDILRVIEIFKEYKNNKEVDSFPGIIAKIERPEAVSNLDEIVKLSDGIMVARGDLGVELPLERIPKIQRDIIITCQKLSKPVIIATQMLYSMVYSLRPTRSEVDDIYNAVISGADCLMLSDETAVGKHPIKVINMFNTIIKEAEKDLIPLHSLKMHKVFKAHDIAHAVANSACELVDELRAKVIVTFTKSGFTGLLISKNRPNVNILAITPKKSVMRKLSLYWGVQAILEPDVKNTDDIINVSENCVLENKMADKGDIIIITAGLPIGFTGVTNLIKVHYIS